MPNAPLRARPAATGPAPGTRFATAAATVTGRVVAGTAPATRTDDPPRTTFIDGALKALFPLIGDR